MYIAKYKTKNKQLVLVKIMRARKKMARNMYLYYIVIALSSDKIFKEICYEKI